MSFESIKDLLILFLPALIVIAALMLMKRERPRRSENKEDLDNRGELLDRMDLYAQLKFLYERRRIGEMIKLLQRAAKDKDQQILSLIDELKRLR